MRRVTLEEFLRQARPYECWRAPLDPRLYQSLLWSGCCIALMGLLLCELPWLQAAFGGLLGVVDHAWIALVIVNVSSAMVYIALLKHTHGLRTGRLAWHWVAMAITVVGVADGFILVFVAANIIVMLGLSILELAINLILGILVLLWHLIVMVFKLLLGIAALCLGLTALRQQRSNSDDLPLLPGQGRGPGGLIGKGNK
jgi:hypothetical protein